MREQDYDEFVSLLDDAYAFQKDKLTPKAKAVFFRAMSAFPLEVVRAAMSAHMLDPKAGKWAMQPADLMAQIERMTGGDGRPGAEEAWAIALTSRDEAETVVWTQEMAEAFAICSPVLQTGDEVGARMAFKEAYLRLTGEARRNHVPARWSPSLGWDMRKREAALKKAATAGLLPAPSVAALLPPPEGAPLNDIKAREQIAKIKQMMADMYAEQQREADLHKQRERDVTQAAKDKANEQVANYRRKDAA